MPDSKLNPSSATGERPNQDIAGDKQAQEGVRAERQRLNDVLNMLPAYVILLTPGYHVPFANRFFEQRFGKSEGRRCYEYLFNRTAPCEICETFKVLKTNAPHRWEWTGPDGRNYDIHDFPFTDVDGSPLIMEVGLDITERKTAEAEVAKHREHLQELVKERTGQVEATNELLRAEIIERKQAEERLCKERDFSAAVLDTAGALIVVLDKEGRITRFNRACEALTGYSAAEVLGRAIWEFLIPPEELPGVRQVWEALQAGDFPNQHENHWIARDGSRRLIAWSNTAIVTPEGRIASIIGTGLEITQRKLAEAALERSERLYRAIGESIDYGVWVCEPDGRNIYASPSFLKLVGLTQEQCSNFGWGDVLHPEDAARTIAAWKECVRTGGTWDIEHRFRGVDGQWHPILARGVPVRDEQGRVTCWAGINLDISRLKQAEREIFDTNQRLQALMRAVPVGVSFSDDPTCRRITGNPTVLAQFEVTAADNLSASASDPVAPGRQVRFFREGRPVEDADLPLQRAVAENSVIPPVELEILLPSGRRWFAETSGAPVRGPHGEVVGGLAVTVDITARKRAEAELRCRADELRASIEELTRFNQAMVGRELRMIELKQEVNELCARLSHPPRYPLQAAQDDPGPPKTS